MIAERIKTKSRSILTAAIKKGKIIRPDSCSDCGIECKPHGHHTDYNQPLNVAWLCKMCHIKRHTGNREPKKRIIGIPPNWPESPAWEHFPEKLTFEMDRLGLTQAKAADLLEVSPRAVWKWLHDEPPIHVAQIGVMAILRETKPVTGN